MRLPLINLSAPAPGTERKGMDLELADAIFAEAKCDLVLSDGVSRLRRDLMFSQGQVDLMLAASNTPERQAIARFSSAYRMEVVRLFATPENLARYDGVKSFDDILRLGERLLVPSGGWYGADYAAAEAKLQAHGQLSTYKNFDQGLKMLEAGRAGLIMGDFLGVNKAAAKAGMRIAPLAYVVLRAPVHLMLSRASTSEQDLQRIDAAIARLEARGALKAIRHKYCDSCDPE
ncbi:MAG: transporter substrate-binding domain-containing protein [Pseudomonadota bacterium]